jgi:ATP diphosphatase
LTNCEDGFLVENQARYFGFKWDHYQRLLAKVHDECQEVAEAIEFSHKPEKLQEELGDLILVIFSFDMYCDFHPKETIQKSLDVMKIRLNTARVTGISDNLF